MVPAKAVERRIQFPESVERVLSLMGDTATGTAEGRGVWFSQVPGFCCSLHDPPVCALLACTLRTEIYTGHLQSCLDCMLVPLALYF